eukprot:gene4209-4770_t
MPVSGNAPGGHQNNFAATFGLSWAIWTMRGWLKPSAKWTKSLGWETANTESLGQTTQANCRPASFLTHPGQVHIMLRTVSKSAEDDTASFAMPQATLQPIVSEDIGSTQTAADLQGQTNENKLPPIDVEALLWHLEALERGKEVGVDQLKKEIIQNALRQSSDFDKYVALSMVERLKLFTQEKRETKTAFYSTVYASLWQHIGCPPEQFGSYVWALLGDRDYERVVEAIGKVDKVFGAGDSQHGKSWPNHPSQPPPSLMPHPPRPGPYQALDRQQECQRRRCFICNATGHIAAHWFTRHRFNADSCGPSRPNKRK